MSSTYGDGTKILWKDRKRWCGLPWSFTRYSLVEKEGSWLKLFTSIGLFSTVCDQINLYRIYDITVNRTLSNKIWGTGTITLHCNMNNVDQVNLIRVKDPYKVRAMLFELIEIERAKKGYRIAEFAG